MEWYGVCPSGWLQYHVVGLLLWAQWVVDIDRLLHGWHHSSKGPQHGMQQRMWIVLRFSACVGS